MDRSAFSFAFQPIVHAPSGRVWSHEALIRGPAGEPAGQVLSGLDEPALHRLDATGRGRAIDLAVRLGLQGRLNLNFLPRSLGEDDGMLEAMFLAAQRHGLPLERLVLEVTESEAIGDLAGFAQRMRRVRALGLQLAIDDFGAGHCGLNLLAEFQPAARARRSCARCSAPVSTWASRRSPRASRRPRNTAGWPARAWSCSRATCSAAPASRRCPRPACLTCRRSSGRRRLPA